MVMGVQKEGTEKLWKIRAEIFPSKKIEQNQKVRDTHGTLF